MTTTRSLRSLWVSMAVAGLAVAALTGCTNGSTDAGANGAATTAATSSGATTTPSTAPSSTSSASTTPPGEVFAFGETVSITNKGEPAAELTIERPVDFVSTNPYAKALHGRFVYVSITFKVTGSVAIPVQSNDFEVVLPDGDVEFHLSVPGRPAEAPAELDEVSVKPGETLVGSVAYDVPKDVELKVAYAPVLKNLGVWS
jgi:hypothetical protein